MSAFNKRPCVKLIVGLLTKDPELIDRVRKKMEKKFGPIDCESPLLDFTYTKYYEKEFGTDIKRKFYGFERPVPEDSRLYKLKLITGKMESELTENGRRRINIDPGIISLSKLILFTTKDYNHRIYLNGGIFAEITLSFQDGSFRPWPWTYNDYKTGAYIDFFNNARDLFYNTLSKKA